MMPGQLEALNLVHAYVHSESSERGGKAISKDPARDLAELAAL